MFAYLDSAKTEWFKLNGPPHYVRPRKKKNKISKQSSCRLANIYRCHETMTKLPIFEPVFLLHRTYNEHSLWFLFISCFADTYLPLPSSFKLGRKSKTVYYCQLTVNFILKMHSNWSNSNAIELHFMHQMPLSTFCRQRQTETKKQKLKHLRVWELNFMLKFEYKLIFTRIEKTVQTDALNGIIPDAIMILSDSITHNGDSWLHPKNRWD